MWLINKLRKYYREAEKTAAETYQYSVTNSGALTTTSDEIVQSEQYRRLVKDFSKIMVDTQSRFCYNSDISK